LLACKIVAVDNVLKIIDEINDNFCSTLQPCATATPNKECPQLQRSGSSVRRHGWRSWRRARARLAELAARAHACGRGWLRVSKIKAHPTDLGGATQERVPSSNSNASSSKAKQASGPGQAPQALAAASAARDYNIVTNMKSLCMTL